MREDNARIHVRQDKMLEEIKEMRVKSNNNESDMKDVKKDLKDHEKDNIEKFAGVNSDKKHLPLVIQEQVRKVIGEQTATTANIGFNKQK